MIYVRSRTGMIPVTDVFEPIFSAKMNTNVSKPSQQNKFHACNIFELPHYFWLDPPAETKVTWSFHFGAGWPWPLIYDLDQDSDQVHLPTKFYLWESNNSPVRVFTDRHADRRKDRTDSITLTADVGGKNEMDYWMGEESQHNIRNTVTLISLT